MSENSNVKSAQDVHHRLEFYWVALAFTIVAFGMQTGKLTGNPISDTAEIAAWVLFVLSGVVGLWRLEYIPVAYRTYHSIQTLRYNIDTWHHQYHEDDEDDRPEWLILQQAQLDDLTPKLERIEANNIRKYFWQKLFLVGGLCLLLVSRALSQLHEWY